jgi:hypothetical protein
MLISIYFTDLRTVEGTVIGPTGMPATGITVVAYKDVTPPPGSRCIQAISLDIDFTGTDNLWDVSKSSKMRFFHYYPIPDHDACKCMQ